MSSCETIPSCVQFVRLDAVTSQKETAMNRTPHTGRPGVGRLTIGPAGTELVVDGDGIHCAGAPQVERDRAQARPQVSASWGASATPRPPTPVVAGERVNASLQQTRGLTPSVSRRCARIGLCAVAESQNSTDPRMATCVRPPTQAPSPSVSTLIRPRLPRAVPCRAT